MSKHFCYWQYYQTETWGISGGCASPEVIGKMITLEPHTKVGKISAANKVPPTLALKVIEEDIPDNEEGRKIQYKSAQVDLSNSKSKQVKVDPEEILQKIDLLGITD